MILDYLLSFNFLQALVCFACAGWANAVMDKLQFRYDRSLFARFNNQQFWDPSISWKNKYKDYDAGDERPRFPLATTALVALTDGWHLMQTVMLTFFALSITNVSGTPTEAILSFLVPRIAFGLVFTFFFHKSPSEDAKTL